MKVNIQESDSYFNITIEPETVEESAKLMRLATTGKREIETIELYPCRDGSIYYRQWFKVMQNATPGIER